MFDHNLSIGHKKLTFFSLSSLKDISIRGLFETAVTYQPSRVSTFVFVKKKKLIIPACFLYNRKGFAR